MSLKDRQRIASNLGISTMQFTRRYAVQTRKKFHLKQLRPQCPFLKDNQCSIYEARPIQCRTWPFWPENMKKKVWQRSIKRSCAGVGKGRLYSVLEIGNIMKTQNRSR
ncbi:MAG: YkgJ family cysteine cluster protein [Candidatus Binatia bacterium]